MLWKTIVLIVLIICSGFTRNKSQHEHYTLNRINNNKTISNNLFYKNFSANAFPFVENKNTLQEKTVDTTSLKSSQWYQNALLTIAKKEYEFCKVKENKIYKNNNPKNQLSFEYDKDGFLAKPFGKANWQIQFKLLDQDDEGFWRINENIAHYTTPTKTVEYLNTEQGMRQNFIIQKPLQDKKDLSINFALHTNLKIVCSLNAIQFFKENKNVFNYNDLRVWDANHKKLNAHFKKEKNNYAIVVDAKDAVYPITIDPISSTPTHTLEQNQSGASLGFSVSSAGDINGDGYSDVIVGAPTFSNGQLNEGAVFVYNGSIDGIISSSSVQLESNQINAAFGVSISTAGDINGDGYSDIVIGATLYDNGQLDEGTASVYYGSVSGLNITPTILEINQPNAQMGQSVACAGDVNGDGFSDIVVGAIKFSNGQTEEGGALLFYGSIGGIITSPAVTLESNIPFSTMGWSVASLGDVNGDGFSDVIIGAPNYNNGAVDEGAAYIYYGSITGLASTPALIIENNLSNSQMGFSVASAGDINGDGYSDALIGALNYSNGQASEGALYMHLGSLTGLSASYTTLIESNITDASYGNSVACAGDVNGDGYSDILVGAAGYQNGEVNEGALYLYNGSATGLNTNAIIREGNQAGAFLGQSVSSAGDVNGDGYSDVLGGAYLYDNGQTDEGVCFTYYGAMNNFSNPNVVLADGMQNSAYSGYSVACAGDVNGDGFSDVVVSAYGYNEGGVIADAGRVFIYHGSSNGLSATYNYLINPSAYQAFSWFGKSVASAGDVNGDGYSDVIVGAYLFDNGQINEGAAFVYYGSSAGLSTTPNVILDDANQNDAQFGISVASAGDVNGDGYSDVIVGANFYDVGANIDEGRAYVYYGSNLGLSNSPNVILNGANKIGAFFGNSVATAGDVNGDGYGDVIIGAYFFSVTSLTYEGRAYVYHGSPTGLSTTPALTLQGENQVNSFFGTSAASGGDINGDGFSDVIIGALAFTDGIFTEEGRAYIYYGSPLGLNNTFTTLDPLSQAFVQYGNTVASAGDINGDGYSDVIIGAPLFDDPSTNEGKSYVFLGSPTGINTIPSFAPADANQSFAQFGFSVSAAGDVNGDGTSDLLVGSPFSFATFNTAGKTFVYYGNSSTGTRNNLRLYLNDLTTIYNSNTGTGNTDFGVGLFSKNFLGRTKGKIVWETKLNHDPFNGNPMANSTAFTAQQISYTNLGISGIELKAVADKILTAHSFTKIRVRTKYDPVTAITGQVYSPWRYIQENLTGSWMGALPVDLKEFKANWLTERKTANIQFTVENESNMCCYIIEKSIDGTNFIPIGTISATNQTVVHQYQFIDQNAKAAKQYYRLKMKALNGKEAYSNITLLTSIIKTTINIYPNPATEFVNVQMNKSARKKQWQVLNNIGVALISGNTEMQSSFKINVQHLQRGVYRLKIYDDENEAVLQFVKE